MPGALRLCCAGGEAAALEPGPARTLPRHAPCWPSPPLPCPPLHSATGWGRVSTITTTEKSLPGQWLSLLFGGEGLLVSCEVGGPCNPLQTLWPSGGLWGGAGKVRRGVPAQASCSPGPRALSCAWGAPFSGCSCNVPPLDLAVQAHVSPHWVTLATREAPGA